MINSVSESKMKDYKVDGYSPDKNGDAFGEAGNSGGNSG
jgi:hypothetical protein